MIEKLRIRYKVCEFFGTPVFLSPTVPIFSILMFFSIRTVKDSDVFIQLYFPVMLFLVLVLHELGHAISAKFMGIEVKEIELNFLGGALQLNLPFFNNKWLLVWSAGPLLNSAVALAVMLIPNWESNIYLYLFVLVNFIFVAINLIPLVPMDGGYILESILCMFTKRFWAIKKTVKVSLVLGLCVILLLIQNTNAFQTAGLALYFVWAIKKYEKTETARAKIQGELSIQNLSGES